VAGESCPADGIIISSVGDLATAIRAGQSNAADIALIMRSGASVAVVGVDESMLTGESIAVQRRAGDSVCGNSNL